MACSVSGCKKKEIKDGFCKDHLPKGPKAETPVYTVALARPESGKVNESFATLANSDKKAQPYKQRIEFIRSNGSATGGEELVHEVSCLHDTQPSNNVTVWYSWKGNAMTVWGLGKHTGGEGAGNSKYSMLWYDGTNKTWTRPRS